MPNQCAMQNAGTRYPDVDINRCVQILNDAGYKGYISMEYEGGGDPLEGALKLMADVVEAKLIFLFAIYCSTGIRL